MTTALIVSVLVVVGWLEYDAQAWLEQWCYRRHFED